MIKAIETRYNGYRFRSRTEARWAVFFDAMGVRYRYEPEGLVVNGVPYLPDFLLLDDDIYFEVKGRDPTKQEVLLCSELRCSSGKAVALAVGPPGESGDIFLWAWDLGDSSGGSCDLTFEISAPFGFCYSGGKSRLAIDWPTSSDRTVFRDSSWEETFPKWRDGEFVSKPFEDAIAKSRSARFEFGESGAA